MAGLRYTNYKESDLFPAPAKQAFFNENSVTPVAAFSYDIAKGIRAYVSYVQALQRGGIAPDGSPNAGQSFGPIKSTQYETGIKIQRANWGGTLAAYTTSVPSEFNQVAVPGSGFVLGQFVRDGERRFRGIEFDAHWQLSKEWLLQYAFSYLDATQTKASSAALVGLRVPGTTAYQTSGYVEYSPSFFDGFKAFGGVRYSGNSYGQVDDSFYFSPATLADAGISYSFAAQGKQWRLQANVQNITDKWYWVPAASGTGLSPGAPRTFSLSLGVETGHTGGAAPRRLNDGTLNEKGWYIGLAAGAARFNPSNFDVRALVNPALGRVEDGVRISHKTAWEVAATAGYDFGLFRGEVEFSNQQANLKRVTVNSTAIPLDALGRPAGTYDDASGNTGILAFMANGLLDIGGNAQSRWALEAGGGIGLARLHQHRWELQDSVPQQFGSENITNFAWQALVGTRYRLTDHLEATLRYRYFNLPNLALQTASANVLDGGFHTHSVLVGVNFRL